MTWQMFWSEVYDGFKTTLIGFLGYHVFAPFFARMREKYRNGGYKAIDTDLLVGSLYVLYMLIGAFIVSVVTTAIYEGFPR